MAAEDDDRAEEERTGGGDHRHGTPDASSTAAQRARMVAEQIAARGVSDPRVLAALRAVPRHCFAPPGLAHAAHDDGPLPLGKGQTLSQPYIVALMTEALALRGDERVLEIGTGSGYQTAVLAELTAHVHSIEILPGLARQAAATLADCGYDSVALAVGDGAAGWPEAAPFEAIIVTAAPPAIPPALIAQLARGGRLVVPVGSATASQELRLVTRDAGGALHERSLAPVAFVPMTGAVGRRQSE